MHPRFATKTGSDEKEFRRLIDRYAMALSKVGSAGRRSVQPVDQLAAIACNMALLIKLGFPESEWRNLADAVHNELVEQTEMHSRLLVVN